MIREQRHPETQAEAHLAEVLQSLNLSASNAERAALAQYCNEVMAWNQRVNVTGAKDVVQFISGPLFDALTLLTVLDSSHRQLVDIGSGGGLPAIPLSILHPEISITLVEPRQKRVQFLQHLVSEFELNATVLHTQDRELKQPLFDGASAQAVFPPKKWLIRAKKLVRDGGKIYTLTSEPVTPAMCPANVQLETQKTFMRDHKERYAARLSKKAPD